MVACPLTVIADSIVRGHYRPPAGENSRGRITRIGDKNHGNTAVLLIRNTTVCVSLGAADSHVLLVRFVRHRFEFIVPPPTQRPRAKLTNATKAPY